MPYYTVESRYNGKLFRFNVYSSKVESLIPAYTFTQTNHAYKLDNGYELYYESTNEKNGLTITIEAKKHHRQQYIDAVKSQLLYFDDVVMTIHEEGRANMVNHKAGIFYEDDNIILSDNSYWSKPHILINRVNYGYVSFEELELEQKNGNIGIKVNPEEVSINPSRESLVWDDTTKTAVLNKFKAAVDTATRLIQDELQEDDFINWIRVCYQIASRYQSNSNNNSIVCRLAGIIDLSQVEPSFRGNKSIRFKPTALFHGMECIYVTSVTITSANKKKFALDRKVLKYGIGNEAHLPIVLVSEKLSNRKDKYLCSQYSSGFIIIRKPKFIEGLFTEEEADYALPIWNLLTQSKQAIAYETIIVPEDFTGTEEEEDFVEAQTVEEVITHHERRKQQGKTIVHAVRKNFGVWDLKDFFTWQRIELPISDINQWKEEEIFYGHNNDEGLLLLAAFISRMPVSGLSNHCRLINGQYCSEGYWIEKIRKEKVDLYSVASWDAFRCQTFFDNPTIKIFKVAESNSRYYRDFKHIRKFFMDVTNNKLTMSNVIIKWNTARKMKERFHKLDFMYNFDQFCTQRTELYKELSEYISTNYRSIEKHLNSSSNAYLKPDTYEALIEHLNKVEQFQLFVNNCTDTAEIATVAKEMWGNDKINDAQAVDMELYAEFEELLDWAEPIFVLLNRLPLLTGKDKYSDKYNAFDTRVNQTTSLPDDFISEMKSYLEWKNVLK